MSNWLHTIQYNFANLLRILILIDLFVPLAELIYRRKNLYFTERKATGIVILYVQFNILFLTCHLDLDLPRCLFLSGFQTEILCVFLFSLVRFPCPICPTLFQFTTHHHSISLVPSVPLSFSSPPTTTQFPLSHLSHSLSVHHPPTFNDQYISYSYSLHSSVHPPATPSLFNTISPSVPVLAQYFRVQSLENKHKHTTSNTILCTPNCLFTSPSCCMKSLFMNSCIRYAVF